MTLQGNRLACVRRLAVIASLGGALGLCGVLTGGITPAFGQSGELGDVIFLEDVPGFVGDAEADTVIACRPDRTCVTADGNVLAGFRPAVWPDLRSVGDDLVIETDVQVLATAFGRVLAREGVNVETFASAPGHPIDSVDDGPSDDFAVAITPHASWAPNNFEGSTALWISYANTGIDGVAAQIGTTFTVSESFTVPPGTTASVEGFVFADDTARVVLIENGNEQELFDFNRDQQTCANGPIGCEVTDKGDLELDALPPGNYTLEFTALQDSSVENPADNPFGLMYAFDVSLDLLTVADFCWTFDGGMPGEKVCISIAECTEGDCSTTLDQCPASGTARIALTSGPDGDAICDDLAQQFFDRGVTEAVEDFQFVVGLDVPDTAQPGSVRLATCTTSEVTYVPICRDPASKVVDAMVFNDIPVFAFETPRCVKLGGRTYC